MFNRTELRRNPEGEDQVRISAWDVG